MELNGEHTPATVLEHPIKSLLDKAKDENLDIISMAFAEKMDSESKSLRSEFHYPKMSDLPKSKFKFL